MPSDLLFAEVALGRVYETDSDIPALTQAPPNYDSVHAVKSSQERPSSFTDDEFVVYNVAQQRVKYVIELVSSNQATSALGPTAQTGDAITGRRPTAGGERRAAELKLPRPPASRPGSVRRPSSQARGAVGPTSVPAMTRSVPTHSTTEPAPLPDLGLVPVSLPAPTGKPLGTRNQLDGGMQWRLPLSSYTALAFRLKDLHGTRLASWRKLIEPAAVATAPPHIVVCSPFIQLEQFSVAVDRVSVLMENGLQVDTELVDVLSEPFSSGQRRVEVRLSVQQSPALAELVNAVFDALALDAPADFEPSLVLGQASSTQQVQALRATFSPARCQIDAVCLLTRRNASEPWMAANTIPLGTSDAGATTAAVDRPADWRLDVEASEGKEEEDDDNAADALYFVDEHSPLTFEKTQASYLSLKFPCVVFALQLDRGQQFGDADTAAGQGGGRLAHNRWPAAVLGIYSRPRADPRCGGTMHSLSRVHQPIRGSHRGQVCLPVGRKRGRVRL